MKPTRLRPITKSICIGSALLSGISITSGQDASRVEKLEKENQDLRRRLEALEAAAQKEGIVPSGEAPKNFMVKALSEITLSGFVTASYFYDLTVPADRESNGYLWNTTHNSFSLNKVKVTLASKPAERSGEK